MIQLFNNGKNVNPSQIYQTVENSYKEREKRMLEENAKNKLTKEQKRKDEQEKIKLGLIKPKETKLKYSNMIQLLKE